MASFFEGVDYPSPRQRGHVCLGSAKAGKSRSTLFLGWPWGASEARHAHAGGTACRLSPATESMATRAAGEGRLRELVEQRFGCLQVGRVEAFGEPVVGLDQ
jgi:hypothetical protein